MYSKQHKIWLKIAQRKLCKTSYPWALKCNIIRDIDIYCRQQILILKIRWLKNVKVNGGSKMPFFIEECHLVELEGWSGVALNEHVTARGLVFDRAVLLLDLHDPKTKESYRLVCSIGPPLFSVAKKKIICRLSMYIFFHLLISCLPTLAVRGPRWPWAGQRACPTFILNNYNNVRLFSHHFHLCNLLSHSDFSSPAASLLPRLLWWGPRSRLELGGIWI